MEKKMDLTNTRPFNVEHAKAGAPYCCRSGKEAAVLKWDGRRPGEPLVGTIGADDIPASWAANGSYIPDTKGALPDDLVMLPLGMIDGKPAFVGDKISGPHMHFIVEPMHAGGDWSRCKWPAPDMVYPETQMANRQINEAIAEGSDKFVVFGGTEAGRRVANAALRHAIDANQVVPISEAKPCVRPHNPYTGQLRDPRDIESDPMGVLISHPGEPLRPAAPASIPDRDMVIAERVRIAAMVAWNPARGYRISEDAQEIRERIRLLDLANIIAGIPL